MNTKRFLMVCLALLCIGSLAWGEVCQDVRVKGDFAFAEDAPLGDVRDVLLECYEDELVDGFGFCLSVPVVIERGRNNKKDGDAGIDGDWILCGGVPPDYTGFVLEDPFEVGFEGLIFNNPGLYQTERGNICLLEHSMVNEDTFVAERWLAVAIDNIVSGTDDFSGASGWLASDPFFSTAPTSFKYEGWICTP